MLYISKVDCNRYILIAQFFGSPDLLLLRKLCVLQISNKISHFGQTKISGAPTAAAANAVIAGRLN